MVGPYVTTLGEYSLAVNAERLLLEDPASHSILSLHPAVSATPGRKPSPCVAVEAFATGSDRMEVTWRPVDGIEAVTVLRLAESGRNASEPARLELRVRFRNTGTARVALAGLHPLFFAAEGPGALALGREDLRTLASRRPGGTPCLLRLDGTDLVSRHFGAWFPEAGSPMLLLAAAEGAAASLVFRAEGARGKMLGLRLDWDASISLEPGATIETPAIELVMGRADIHEELHAWAARADAAALVPEFAASGEVVEEEPEPEPEPEPAAAPETELEPEPELEAQPEGELEAQAPGEPEAEPSDELEAEAAAEAETEVAVETSGEPESETEPETETDAEAEPSDESERETGAEVGVESETETEAPAESETEPQPETHAEPETEPETESPAMPEPEPATEPSQQPIAGPELQESQPQPSGSWGRGRCAAFRRAMRATRAFEETGRGAWPRWASGRRYQPVTGTSTRTRGY